MIRKYVTALAISMPFAAHATIPVQMSCDMTVKEFFAPLIQQNLIDSKPFKVEGPSVNYFKPHIFRQLTVYGMPVANVVGATNEPLLFLSNGSQGKDLFGVVVREGIANVQAQLNSVAAKDMSTYRVDTHTTIILCKGVSQ